MEKIVYRNWDECYRISNGQVDVVVNASSGGRIMVFQRQGVNIIFEDTEQDGLTLADYLQYGFDPDGGRFDYGQEEKTRAIHTGTWMGPWSGKMIGDHCLQITSTPDRNLGILSTRIFNLDPITSKLLVIQTMKNISDHRTEYFFWGRTLVKTGGRLFMPLRPSSAIPGKWGRYIWETPERFENDPGDRGVTVKDNIFSLDPLRAENAKYGNDSHAGWMAYAYNSLLFVKKYGYFPEAVYTEKYGLINIFYTNRKTFAEMEPVSPAAFLEPGQEFSWSEEWFLLDYPPCKDPDFNLADACRFILLQTG